jgi:LRP1 type putative zinc finger protein
MALCRVAPLSSLALIFFNRRAPTHLNCMANWLAMGPSPACMQCREPLPAPSQQIDAQIEDQELHFFPSMPNASAAIDAAPASAHVSFAELVARAAAAEEAEAEAAFQNALNAVSAEADMIRGSNISPGYNICPCGNRAPFDCVHRLCRRCCLQLPANSTHFYLRACPRHRPDG